MKIFFFRIRCRTVYIMIVSSIITIFKNSKFLCPYCMSENIEIAIKTTRTTSYSINKKSSLKLKDFNAFSVAWYAPNHDWEDDETIEQSLYCIDCDKKSNINLIYI